jgi:hypothetical protein
MPLSLIELLSGAGFLLPVLVVIAASARRESTLAELVLLVPIAIGADLAAILLLTHLVPLGMSAWLVRGAWLVGGAGWLALRRAPRPRWPRELPFRVWLFALAAGVLTVLPFLAISRTYNIWDREWHNPLAASLGGQTLPFHNVYEPSVVLRYHFTGDVVAAVLRALSMNVLSSSRSLALAHDLFLGLTAAWMTLLARGLGARRLWACALFAVAVVWHGPWPRKLASNYDGYSFFLFAQLSYRPHVPVSLFAMTSFVGALVVLGRNLVGRGRVLAALAASASILATSDETTIGVLGLSLGIVWLFAPRIVAERRTHGLVALGVLGAAVLLPNLIFSASFSPGGPVQAARWHWPPALAPLEGASTPLFSGAGGWILLLALGPVLACALALAITWMRGRDGGVGRLVTFGVVVTLMCLVFATCLTVNNSPAESQRFFVAPFIATLVPSVALLAVVGRSAVARALMIAGLGIPAIYTVYFNRHEAEEMHEKGFYGGPHNALIPESLFDVDCRKATGAQLTDRPRPVYVDQTGFYLFAVCRPLFAPGESRGWPLKMSPHLDPVTQLRELGPMGGDTEAFCRADAKRDVVCARLTATPGRCVAEGSAFLRCPITAEDRAALVPPAK